VIAAAMSGMAFTTCNSFICNWKLLLSFKYVQEMASLTRKPDLKVILKNNTITINKKITHNSQGVRKIHGK
jgi:hypothetical protein